MWLAEADTGADEQAFSLRRVGLWVLLSSVLGDAPMRALLHRNLGHNALRGCDMCSMLGVHGEYNATKYLGYCQPCPSYALHPDDGESYGECDGPRRQFRMNTVHLSSAQMVGRDTALEKRVAAIKAQYPRKPSGARNKIEKAERFAGTKGRSEHARAGLPYWCPLLMSPFAVYHVTYLGIGKDFLRWIVTRLSPNPEKHRVQFLYPKDVGVVLRGMLGRIVCRNKPDVDVKDFTKELGNLTMAHMQLLYEVAVPYLCHDLVAFKVPKG